MSRFIRIDNVPDELYRRLENRAVQEGMSLSDYLLGELRDIADRPGFPELRERLRGRRPVKLSVSPVEAVRSERDHR